MASVSLTPLEFEALKKYLSTKDAAAPVAVTEARKVIRGLLTIAEQAMPDTSYATDRRVLRAQRWLKRNPK